MIPPLRTQPFSVLSFFSQGVGFRTPHKSLRDVCRAQSETITPSKSALGVGLTHFTTKQKKSR